MTDRLNKTSICSIVFLDIINYSKKPVTEQIDDKTFFNKLINEAIQNVAPNDRIILDTGDGAAITLMGAPEEALFIALSVRDGIVEHNKGKLNPMLVRIGINLGSIRVMKDLNDRPNIIGDGINVAQRIMSFAGENQILVSRSYYEVTSRLTKEITDMFTYSGIKQDKHIREHEVYIIKSKEERAAKPVRKKVFYSVENISATGRVFAKTYLVPFMLAALFVALVAWYLLILRPIPSVGKEGGIVADTPITSQITDQHPVSLKDGEPQAAQQNATGKNVVSKDAETAKPATSHSGTAAAAKSKTVHQHHVKPVQSKCSQAQMAMHQC